ncbi:hypothetical protein ASF62_11115 [Leifsonia sp. Leaf325]|nr:hypothetical protein ASF62_11115 [Leifsonia sp. Leaf325]
MGVGMIVGFIVSMQGSGNDPQGVCNKSAADYLGISTEDLTITEYLETPGGSIDVRGSYPGGTYACGLGVDPFGLHQTMIYKDDGTVETAFNG